MVREGIESMSISSCPISRAGARGRWLSSGNGRYEYCGVRDVVWEFPAFRVEMAHRREFRMRSRESGKSEAIRRPHIIYCQPFGGVPKMVGVKMLRNSLLRV